MSCSHMYAVLWLDLTLHENHESSRPTLYPVSSKRTLNLTAVSASGNYVGWSIFPILLLLVFPLSASLINHVRTGFHILYVRSSVCFGRQWKYQCFGFFCDFVLGYQIKLDNKPKRLTDPSYLCNLGSYLVRLINAHLTSPQPCLSLTNPRSPVVISSWASGSMNHFAHQCVPLSRV